MPMEFGPTQVFVDHHEVFDLYPRALELANMLGDAIDQKKITDVPKGSLLVLTAAIRSIASIPHVCNAGHSLEASPFVRGLFEKMVWLDYLRTDPERLSFLLTRNFELARIVADFDRADSQSWAYEPDLPDAAGHLSQAMSAFGRVRREFLKQFPGQDSETLFPIGVEKLRSFLRRSWAFITFRRMVERVLESEVDERFRSALRSDFARQYAFDCQIGHSVGFYHGYIAREGLERIEFHPEPSGEWADWVLLTGLKYFSRIMILCADSIKADLSPDLTHAIVRFQEEVRERLMSRGIIRGIP